MYIIRALTNSQTVNLIVRKNLPVMINHNQIHTQTTNPNTFLSYKIYSVGSIEITLKVNKGPVNVIVSKDNNSTKLVSRIITSVTPYVFIINDNTSAIV